MGGAPGCSSPSASSAQPEHLCDHRDLTAQNSPPPKPASRYRTNMLKPLETFYCDTCGTLISELSHGFVEWNVTEGEEPLDFGWRIAHLMPHSPKNSTVGCHKGLAKSAPLKDFVGPDSQAQLLTFLDIGEHIKGSELRSSVRDLREFVEFVRRISIPFYEEARIYWDEAIEDNAFEGLDEIGPYTQNTLKALIERYA